MLMCEGLTIHGIACNDIRLVEGRYRPVASFDLWPKGPQVNEANKNA